MQQPGRAGLAANQIGSSLAVFLKGELFIDRLDDDERRRVMRQIYADQIASAPPGPGRPSE